MDKVAGSHKHRYEYDFVDLREKYDPELLKRYYDELMVPNFGMFDDELEDMSTWAELLSKPKSGRCWLHILMVFEKSDTKRERIIGGSCCEYYPNPNVGLLTYFAVRPEWKQRGVGQFLVKNVLATMEKESKGCGKTLDALFLETNDTEKVSAEKDVMDPAVRHVVLQNLGFRILEFQYVQPALSPEQGKCSDLLFAVHSSFLKPTEDGRMGLRSEVVQAFIKEFFIVLMGQKSVDGATADPDFLNQMKELGSKNLTTVRSYEKKSTVSV